MDCAGRAGQGLRRRIGSGFDAARSGANGNTDGTRNVARFSCDGPAMLIGAVMAFVDNVEFADGNLWIPSRRDITEATSDLVLRRALAASPEQQRLAEIYRKKGDQRACGRAEAGELGEVRRVFGCGSGIDLIDWRCSGRGSAWLERLVRDQEVGGSNPLAPTIHFSTFRVIDQIAETPTARGLGRVPLLYPLLTDLRIESRGRNTPLD